MIKISCQYKTVKRKGNKLPTLFTFFGCKCIRTTLDMKIIELIQKNKCDWIRFWDLVLMK